MGYHGSSYLPAISFCVRRDNSLKILQSYDEVALAKACHAEAY